MSTKLMPLSPGMAAKNFLNAFSPPAEAPMPTTGPSVSAAGAAGRPTRLARSAIAGDDRRRRPFFACFRFIFTTDDPFLLPAAVSGQDAWASQVSGRTGEVNFAYGRDCRKTTMHNAAFYR